MKNLTKKVIIGLVVFSLGILLATTAQAKISAQAKKLGYIPGEVIVTLSAGSSMPALDSNKNFPYKGKEHLFGDLYKLKFDKDVDMDKLPVLGGDFIKKGKRLFNRKYYGRFI